MSTDASINPYAAASKEVDYESPPPPYSPSQLGPWNSESNKPPTSPASYWQSQQPGYNIGYPMQQVGYPNPTSGFNTNDNAMLITEPRERIEIVRQRESFAPQMILSCVVFWLCCWPMGLIAFILAMMANTKSSTTNDDEGAAEARKLGIMSCRTSIAGIIIGVILIGAIIFFQVYYYKREE